MAACGGRGGVCVPARGRELGSGRTGGTAEAVGCTRDVGPVMWALLFPPPWGGLPTGGVSQGPGAVALSLGVAACVSTVPKDRAIGTGLLAGFAAVLFLR